MPILVFVFFQLRLKNVARLTEWPHKRKPRLGV